MAIETLDDLNQILAQCCCEMPECPVPTKECENLYGVVDLAWHIYNTPLDTYYQTWNTEYADGGYRRRTYDQSWNTTFYGVPVVSATATILDADPKTGTITEDYLDPIDEDAAAAAGLSSLIGSLAWDDPSYTYQSECDATLERFNPSGTSDAILQAKFVRFRWVIPQDWTPDMDSPGSYYKITWDVIEEPDGWDDVSPTVFRSFQDPPPDPWEWTGPGDLEDADSWKSPWFEIEPPEVPGTRRVVNVRFECYRSPQFGNKPQVTGEAVELPDP